MEKTPSVPAKRFQSVVLPRVLNCLFYGTICWILATAEIPVLNQTAFVLRKSLFSGGEAIFRVPGTEFLAFRPYLPTRGVVSFIKDTPHQPSDLKTEWLYLAQAQLLPLILDKNPGQKTAIIFCSNENIATLRMQETGYHLVKSFGSGKGIAGKNP